MARTMTYRQAAKELGLSAGTVAAYTLPSHDRRLERRPGNRVTVESVDRYKLERQQTMKQARRKAGKTIAAKAQQRREQQQAAPVTPKPVKIRPVSVREDIIMLRGMLTFIDMNETDRSKLMGHVKKIEQALA